MKPFGSRDVLMNANSIRLLVARSGPALFWAGLVLAPALISGCSTGAAPTAQACCAEEPKLVTVLGYGSRAKYAKLSESDQKIMAMRDAKEDAFRNLLERFGAVSIKYSSRQELVSSEGIGKTSLLEIESSGKVQGVRLLQLIPVGTDMYEAKLEVDLNYFSVTNAAVPGQRVQLQQINHGNVLNDRSETGTTPYRYLSE